MGLGSPIMSISIMSDMWGTFNVREDHLQGLNKGDEFTAFVPAFNKEIKMKVYYLKDQVPMPPGRQPRIMATTTARLSR